MIGVRVPFKKRVAEKLARLSLPNRSARKKELIDIVKKSSLECGRALMELRDDEHWKDTHLSFKEFCDHNFDISGSYLYRLMEGVQIRDSLPENLRRHIVNEGQTRVLSRVPPSSRAEVVERASQFGSPSAPMLREIAENYIPVSTPQKSPFGDSGLSEESDAKPESKSKTGTSEKPKPVYDCVGNIITEEALPFWKRGDIIGALISPIRKAFETIECYKKSRDEMFSKVPDSIVERLKQDYLDLSLAMPYAICPNCKGEPSTNQIGCDNCTNTGMISKPEWDRINPTK